jgi:hypothetical protein
MSGGEKIRAFLEQEGFERAGGEIAKAGKALLEIGLSGSILGIFSDDEVEPPPPPDAGEMSVIDVLGEEITPREHAMARAADTTPAPPPDEPRVYAGPDRKFCEECGARAKTWNAKFCSGCGSKL